MVTLASNIKRTLQTSRRTKRHPMASRWPSRWVQGVLSASFVCLAGIAFSAANAQTVSTQDTEQVATPIAGQAWEAFLPDAKKVGEGQFRRWGFLVYDATLWSATGLYRPNQPYALSLVYARSISRDQIVDASIDQMRDLGIKVSQHPEWQSKLQRVFVDVTEGDSLTGIYMPGQGAVFYAGDRLTGQVDEGLAKAFFAIWLDPKTTAPDLRLALLGQSQ